MPVGTQFDPGFINDQLTQLALQLRNNAHQVSDLFMSVQQKGGGDLAAGFTAIGYSSPDAADAADKLSYMNTLAGIFNGTEAQPATFSFVSALAPLWAGR